MSEVLLKKQEQIIRQLRPEADRVEYLGAGDINNVIFVDDEVFRFPKNEEGAQTLLYEANVLEKLEGQVSLQIPRVREFSDDGAYAIFSYVPGKTLSSEEIMTFTEEQKQALAHTIAGCMSEISSAFSTGEILRLSKQFLPWHKDEDEYYAAILNWQPGTKLQDVYAEYHEKYMEREHETGSPKKIVVYGDYHAGNMLFNGKNELTGLIDFGDLGVGTSISDLRQLYRLGEDIVLHVISDLRNEIGEIDLELVRLHAIMHEISVLLRPESQPPHVNPRAVLAKKLLDGWLGDNWDEV